MLGDKINPLLINPAETPDAQFSSLLERCDGFIFTSRWSDIHPRIYEPELVFKPNLYVDYDPDRDRVALALIKECIEKNIPLLGICGGMQEMQIVMGGKLHLNIAEIETGVTHRVNENFMGEPKPNLHQIDIIPEGLLTKNGMTEGIKTPTVHSNHSQGVTLDMLPKAVRAEAIQGLVVEAFSIEDHPFALGVQFHPEACGLPNGAEFGDVAFSQAIFNHFVDAAGDYHAIWDQASGTHKRKFGGPGGT